MKIITLILVGLFLVLPHFAMAQEIDDCTSPNQCWRVHVDDQAKGTWAGINTLQSLPVQGFNSQTTAFGHSAMMNVSDPFHNTAIGARAMEGSNPGDHGGSYNTAVGSAALFQITDAYLVTAVGASSMSYNRHGYYNSAFGIEALRGDTTGDYQSGHYNVSLGAYSLWANSFGSRNTAVGTFSGAPNERSQSQENLEEPVRGYWNKTGSNNTFLGYRTGSDNGNRHNTIAIGVNALTTADNQMVVGSNYASYLRHAKTTDCGTYTHFDCKVDNEFDEETSSCTVGEIVVSAQGVSSQTLSCVADVGVIRESYWGSGVTSADPKQFNFHASGGEGTDVPGATLLLAGGKGTGAADGGYIVLSTSPAGTSGSTLNTLQDRVIIAPSGKVGIGPSIPNLAQFNITTSDHYGLFLTQTSDVAGGTPVAGAVYFVFLDGDSSSGTYSNEALGFNNTLVYRRSTDSNSGSVLSANSVSGLMGMTSGNGLTIDNLAGMNVTTGMHAGYSSTNGTLISGYGIHLKGLDKRGSGSLTVDDYRHIYAQNRGAISGSASLTVNEQTGLWIDKQDLGSINHGIVLYGDGEGADIVFGSNQEGRIYSVKDGINDGLWAEYGTNITQISPHDPDTGEWIFYSKNTKTGRTVRVNMEELVRDMEKLTGKKYMVESFVENK
jgi:hypothetical protein